MGGPAPYPPEPDLPPCLRMAFEETIHSGKLIGIDLEILGLSVDGDVLVILFLLDLSPHDALENLLPAFGEFGCFFGHVRDGFETRYGDISYADGPASFPRGVRTRGTPGAGRPRRYSLQIAASTQRRVASCGTPRAATA